MLDLSILGFAELVGLAMYVFAFVTCLFGYVVVTTQEILKDRTKRAVMGDRYYPTIRVGTILGRVACTVLPIVNLLAAIFDVAPHILGTLFRWLGELFDQPVVPARRKNGS